MRNLLAFAAGGLFGIGLWLSGMTDTTKVQGWLDFFGAWDPTLAFVMGGAILPMSLAWALVRRRATASQGGPLLGGTFPTPPDPKVGPNLVIGSTLFGMGWGLSGLCPGPAIAALSFGAWPVWMFVAAMLAGMVVAPMLRLQLDTWQTAK